MRRGLHVATRVAAAVSRAIVLATVGLAVTAGPAAADAPTPGDYTSEVTEITPPVDSIELQVVGGDSFLELTVAPGTEVTVLGYEDEPFLRVLADGTVERNDNSPATYLNEDRYAVTDVPADLVGADVSTLEPNWVRVATSGRYAWHDHRIHWMAPNAPPAIERGGSFDWNGPVPLVVDGTDVLVEGRIDYHRSQSVLPWIGFGLIVGVAAALVGRRYSVAPAVLSTVAALGAAGVAWATWSASPPSVGLSPLPLIVAAVGAVVGVAAFVVPERHRTPAAMLEASVLVTWGLLRFSVLTSPVLPTSAPFAVDRAVTAGAIGVGAATIVVVLPRLMRRTESA